MVAPPPRLLDGRARVPFALSATTLSIITLGFALNLGIRLSAATSVSHVRGGLILRLGFVFYLHTSPLKRPFCADWLHPKFPTADSIPPPPPPPIKNAHARSSLQPFPPKRLYRRVLIFAVPSCTTANSTCYNCVRQIVHHRPRFFQPALPPDLLCALVLVAIFAPHSPLLHNLLQSTPQGSFEGVSPSRTSKHALLFRSVFFVLVSDRHPSVLSRPLLTITTPAIKYNVRVQI